MQFPSVIYAATSLFKMLLKYRPEDKAAKKERLIKRAQAEAEGKAPEAKKPIVVKYGLNHVTYLIEQVLILFSLGINTLVNFCHCILFQIMVTLLVFTSLSEQSAVGCYSS